MDKILEQDLEQIDTILKSATENSIEFLSSLNSIATGLTVTDVYTSELPTQGIGAESTLNLFNQHYKSLIVASSGPRYFGYVTGGSTPASITGDWLASVFDQNTQSVNGPGDISAIVEHQAIQLLLSLFNLPTSFAGGFVSGATMSNYTCLAVARQWLGQQLGSNIAHDGITQPLKVLSATPHSSALKCLSMLGIGRSALQQISTIDGREAMDTADLEKKIDKLAGEPFILITSGGTVNTVDYDDMQLIKKLKEKYNFWWHIDAAFGAFAACSEQYKHLLSGWDFADSITIDCHKWLNVPYDSAVYFIKSNYQALQIETFQNSNAPYLGDPNENISYLNLLPENSRRFRALPAWFSLMAYGKQGYQAIVENCIDMANLLAKKIQLSSHYDLLAEVRLNVVAFTAIQTENIDLAGLTKKIMQLINQRGIFLATPTFLNGKPGFRAAFSNWRTTKEDVEITMQELEKVYQLVIKN